MVAQDPNIFLGRGIYPIAEAARLTQVKPATVRAWLRGRRSHGAVTGRGPLLRPDFDSLDVISFLDLIEVLVAGHLKDAGVPLGAVRRAHAAIALHLRTEHPFSRRELCTDGTRVFLRTAQADDERELVDVVGNQHFFDRVMSPHLKRVDYDPTSHLARAWRVSEGVVLDPAVQLGKPTVEGTGIPAEILAAAFNANGKDAELTAAWYGVSPVQVCRAAKFMAA